MHGLAGLALTCEAMGRQDEADEVVDLLRRAGAAQDFQGIAEADPAMSLDDLERVAQLGPYGALIVSWHPNAPEGRREPRNRPQDNSCLT